MEDEAIFLNRDPLKDLLSIELCKNEYYCDGGWFFFYLDWNSQFRKLENHFLQLLLVWFGFFV